MKHERINNGSVFQQIHTCPKSASKAQKWDQGYSSIGMYI